MNAMVIRNRLLFEKIINHATRLDTDCEKVINDQLKYIGIALARLIELIHPQKIIIGGSLVVGKEVFLKKIQDAYNRNIVPDIKSSTQIEFSILDPETGAVGAATLVLQEVFESVK